MAGTAGIGEFELIAEFLAPLAAGNAGACGLKDDAAWLRPRPGHDLILTTDTLVAGIHFLPDDPPDLVARKLIGVNLSDLAAKGAEPAAYLLNLALPRAERDWLARFAEGLAADQRDYGIALLGGDTVSTPGPTTLSATAFGWVPVGRMIPRSGARPGDRIFVTGTLGDAALGLAVLQGRAEAMRDSDAEFLAGRYRRPRPRTALGPRLIGLAHAAADVSDGLLADLGHICATSGVDAEIRTDRLPLSDAARRWAGGAPDAISAALAGGDDYEIVLAAPPEAEAGLRAAAAASGVPIARIGEVAAGAGRVTARDGEGRAVATPERGWQHFARERPPVR